MKVREANRVWVRFADGTEGEADLSDVVGRGVFSGLADAGEFAKVGIDPESGTLCWPGGLDIAPDALYQIGACQMAMAHYVEASKTFEDLSGRFPEHGYGEKGAAEAVRALYAAGKDHSAGVLTAGVD